MPLYLHNVHHLSGLSIGFALLPASMMVALLSPVVSYLIHQHGTKPILLFGFACLTLSAIMQVFFNESSSILFIEIAFLIFGTGWAFILSPSLIAVLHSVPHESSGVATGTLFSLHNMGGAVGLAIGTAIYHHYSYKTLIEQLNGTAHKWIEKAISDPNTAIATIEQHTQLVPDKAETLFYHFFMSGYQASMLLLTLVSIVGFSVILLGLKNQK